MAQRRMISLDVIDTDAFLEMPMSAQLLYFHLNSRADDDGFVAGYKRIARTLGSKSIDLEILIAKKFVIQFTDGVLVIKHWRVNNFVRKDIYKETQYLNLKQTLFIRANGAYTLTDDDRAIPVPQGHYKLEDVDAALTLRQLRLGKGSTGKIVDEASTGYSIRKEEKEVDERPKTKPKYPNARIAFGWFPRPQKSWEINTTELKHGELLFERGEKAVRAALAFVEENKENEYFAKVVKPSDLERKWLDLLAYKKKNNL